MKIAIVGAGFTGLSAALKLVKKNHKVTVFEKEKNLGGLAESFKLPGWKWSLEKHYHHWFTNDSYALSLIRELGLSDRLLLPKSQTSIFHNNRIYPFNSPFNVLSFKALNPFDRIRVCLIVLYLKLLPEKYATQLEIYTAYDWLRKKFGSKSFSILWQPLLEGKFGPYARKVNMAWFWARIKKRTPVLAYMAGGYQILLQKMADKIEASGGNILYTTPFDTRQKSDFDKIIITAPSKIFIQLFPSLPINYKKRLENIPHLHALNLLLVTRVKFLDSTYWLNINDRGFPFIGVIQHTNLADKKYYDGHHLTWIANYLPPDHPFLSMTKEELLKVYLPYLKRINPHLNSSAKGRSAFGGKFLILNSKLFFGPFAQPVFPVNYSRIKPDFYTPLKNVLLANMDMVYPWDRGTNYAIELGYKVAELVG